MQRTHCDLCGKETRRTKDTHVWANKLPEGDPMRRVSATLTFHTSLARGGTKADIDVCDECLVKFIGNVATK